MYELALWIDKHIDEISNSTLYEKYFSAIELDKIADEFFLENLNKGIDIVFTEKLIVRAVHLYSENFMGAKKFKDELPSNLSFDYKKKEVEKMLGKPMSSGGGHESKILGYVELWNKYYLNKYSLHLSFAEGGDRISLITLGSLKFEQEATPE